MNRTIVRLFASPQEAIDALRELQQIGVKADDIGLVASNQEDWAPPQLTDHEPAPHEDASRGVDQGMTAGGLLGAGLGAVVGAGVVAIPGAGAAVAAGWLSSLATGAGSGAAAAGFAGGLVGALKEEGLTDEDAQVCAEAVRRGGAVISVRCEGSESLRIRDVLERHGGVDPEERGQVYREAGWIGFDPAAQPYGRREIDEERQRAKAGQPPEPRSFASDPELGADERSPDPRASFAPPWQPGRDV
jgi:hypothetical protein